MDKAISIYGRGIIDDFTQFLDSMLDQVARNLQKHTNDHHPEYAEIARYSKALYNLRKNERL